MNKTGIIIAGIVIFLIINFIYYISIKGYVKESFGKKWLNLWGNKVWFWQSSIFVSTGGTALVICILKWSNVLNF